MSGLIYSSRSELLASLRDLLSNPEKVERWGAAARTVASGHTSEMVARRVAGSYERVLESKL